VSGNSMKATNANTALYESLSLINRSFEQIHQELDRLQQHDWLRTRAPVKSVELAVRETHAWTMFEILEVLREHEESEWTRLGRVRGRQEGSPIGPRRRSTPK
jgi:hypothetical protein